MRTIGIRAEPNAVTFVVFCSAENAILNVEKFKIPKALTRPEKLKYVRVNLLDILREYEVVVAGIRVTESNSQTLNIDRIQLEGVILEAFASSNLKAFHCWQIASITKQLGMARPDFKQYVDGDLVFEAVENWAELSKVAREACFAALGAAHA